MFIDGELRPDPDSDLRVEPIEGTMRFRHGVAIFRIQPGNEQVGIHVGHDDLWVRSGDRSIVQIYDTSILVSGTDTSGLLLSTYNSPRVLEETIPSSGVLEIERQGYYSLKLRNQNPEVQ